MSSLRARLIASLLALSAAGLLVLGAITYFEQRNFLYDRVDDQARQATFAVAGALADKGIGPAFDRDRPRDGSRQGGRDGGPRGGGPQFGLPPGTYGQRRDANGKVLGSVMLSYDESATAKPSLPSKLETGKLITVDGSGDDDTRFRVLASEDPSGSGSTVVAVPLQEVDQTLNRLLVVEALVIAGVLLVLLLLSRAVVRVGLLPLDRMGHTAGAIAAGDLSRRVDDTDGRTEVGRLGRALNGMLDRLERAFSEKQESEDRLRQFIADASHELRTPLASIRGYAELFRMGATADPGETERAMQRIEDEATRMGVLVEDLLTLARLDEVADAPHAELDLARITGDAVDDARATAPDREITAEVEGPATVTGDAHQLRQVLANLLRNAMMHTPPGTPIDVTLETRGDQVLLAVRDHGPGLPTEDADALFERFWRSEGGRERGKGGAGLGLAIVAAILDAHGGTVSAANAPGGGARFEVVLPALTKDRRKERAQPPMLS